MTHNRATPIDLDALERREHVANPYGGARLVAITVDERRALIERVREAETNLKTNDAIDLRLDMRKIGPSTFLRMDRASGFFVLEGEPIWVVLDTGCIVRANTPTELWEAA